MNLAEFLEARIAEDEQHNRRFREKVTADLSRIKGKPADLSDDHYLRRQDAESASKRRIVEAAEHTRTDLMREADTYAWSLRNIATVYSDHPDYQQEWNL